MTGEDLVEAARTRSGTGRGVRDSKTGGADKNTQALGKGSSSLQKDITTKVPGETEMGGGGL